MSEVIILLQRYKSQHTTLMIPEMQEDSFAKKRFSLYLTYLPRIDSNMC